MLLTTEMRIAPLMQTIETKLIAELERAAEIYPLPAGEQMSVWVRAALERFTDQLTLGQFADILRTKQLTAEQVHRHAVRHNAPVTPVPVTGLCADMVVVDDVYTQEELRFNQTDYSSSAEKRGLRDQVTKTVGTLPAEPEVKAPEVAPKPTTNVKPQDNPFGDLFKK